MSLSCTPWDAAVEVLGVHAFLVEQGLSKESPVVWGDSSSALQLAHRQGTGRLKHVEVRLLAIQSWVSMGRLRLQKVLSADNVADALTKHVSRHHVELGHAVPMPSDRAKPAFKLVNLIDERPQDGIEMLLINAAYADFLSVMIL